MGVGDLMFCVRRPSIGFPGVYSSRLKQRNARTWTHDYGISSEEAKQLGLPVNTDMPQEVYDFMALFAQPTRTRSAVEYVPVPYRGARQGRADG